MNKAREFDQSVVTELKALLGERVTTSASVREHHGKDESYFPYALPDAVVYPHSTEEVRDVVTICRRHGVPMIPFGVGPSLEGHVLAIEGGVTIDLSQMSSVLAVHEEDLDAVVQAGVTRKQLNEYIKHTGLFFPIDPGADATIGGMASTRASGTNAVRYGTMRENVISLTVVLADGRIIKTARRAKKSSAGYDLTRLFVGAEGTLGIITEVTVDSETAVLGALADSVQEVMDLDPDHIEPAPKIGTHLNTEFIRGMGKRDNTFVIILDIDKVFSTDELALVQAEQAEAPSENTQ